MKIMPVQKQTRAGQRTRFKVSVGVERRQCQPGSAGQQGRAPCQEVLRKATAGYPCGGPKRVRLASASMGRRHSIRAGARRRLPPPPPSLLPRRLWLWATSTATWAWASSAPRRWPPPSAVSVQGGGGGGRRRQRHCNIEAAAAEEGRAGGAAAGGSDSSSGERRGGGAAAAVESALQHAVADGERCRRSSSGSGSSGSSRGSSG